MTDPLEETNPSRVIWHVLGWRCVLAVRLYGLTARIGRLADRVDPVARHQGRTALPYRTYIGYNTVGESPPEEPE